MIKKIINHIKVWNVWRKNSLDSKLYKIGVLLCVCNSPTFNICELYACLSDCLEETVKRIKKERRDDLLTK